ncbi:MAG: KH domain-containing protein [Candidatus Nomurabacteria bacterium]|jgi:predicted RNA-binding protein YlqC (UPF0109 family)|nr:KH domain-containing protein [Candidatus Nomurabacteria bacterium]
MATIDEQFVEYIIKSVVDCPDDVKIDRTEDDRGILLSLTVHPDDLGRVIGKGGATAQSLRNLLRALGMKNDARYNLKIVDVDRPEGSRRGDDDSGVVKNTTPKKSDDVEKSTDADVEKDDDLASKTRAELAELDDLDI